MKDVTDIFIINENGILEIEKKEARSIPEFRELLARDKGSEGDADGRKKFFSFKELMYVHLSTHPASMYRDLPDDAKLLKAKEHADLPSNWKEDNLIKAARAKYLVLVNMTSTYHAYVNASKALYAIGEDLQFINQLRERTRNKVLEKIEELEGSTVEEDIQRLNAEIDNGTNRLMDLGNKITTISGALPTAYDNLDKLKVKLLKEKEQGGKVYGGGAVGDREK